MCQALCGHWNFHNIHQNYNDMDETKSYVLDSSEYEEKFMIIESMMEHTVPNLSAFENEMESVLCGYHNVSEVLIVLSKMETDKPVL